MVVALPVKEIEISPAKKNLSRGDGSFDLELQKASESISKKAISPSISMFDMLFESSMVLSDVNNYYSEDIKEEDKTNEKETKEISGQKNPMEAKSQKKPDIEITDLNRIKEILSKFLPPPQIVPLYGMGLNNVQSNIVTKANMQALIDEIVQNAKLLKINDKIELTLMLKEKYFGEMNLSLLSKNGIISIQIFAQSETKKMLEDSILDLETALEEAHIKFDDIKISEVINYNGDTTRS